VRMTNDKVDWGLTTALEGRSTIDSSVLTLLLTGGN
jgi:hypothetical protein